jgi:hypothetical protein
MPVLTAYEQKQMFPGGSLRATQNFEVQNSIKMPRNWQRPIHKWIGTAAMSTDLAPRIRIP